ncbi:hypothetical protein ACU8M5_10750 [Rhizobium leguminosarum]
MIVLIFILLVLVIGLSEIGPIALLVVPLTLFLVFGLFAGLFWLGSVGGCGLVVLVIGVAVVGLIIAAG